MPEKKEPKKKPKINQNLSQKERFIQYAKEVEADESGELFDKAFKKVLSEKPEK